MSSVLPQGGRRGGVDTQISFSVNLGETGQLSLTSIFFCTVGVFVGGYWYQVFSTRVTAGRFRSYLGFEALLWSY